MMTMTLMLVVVVVVVVVVVHLVNTASFQLSRDKF